MMIGAVVVPVEVILEGAVWGGGEECEKHILHVWYSTRSSEALQSTALAKPQTASKHKARCSPRRAMEGLS